MIKSIATSSKDWSALAKIYPQQCNIIDGQVVEIKTVVVHKFRMVDVEDPDLYAGQPIVEWQKSEQGKWVMSHAVDQPEWHRRQLPTIDSCEYAITAKLKAKDYTFWALKWTRP